MMNNCGTCKHWRKPEDRDDYRQVVQFRGDGSDMNSYSEASARDEADDKLFGECQLIDLGMHILMSQPTPLAVTMDASQYEASLYTQAEFGCVLHEEVENGNESNP